MLLKGYDIHVEIFLVKQSQVPVLPSTKTQFPHWTSPLKAAGANTRWTLTHQSHKPICSRTRKEKAEVWPKL